MVQNVAEFSKRSTSNNISQQQKPSLVHRDSDSDIETIEDSNNTKAVEEGGESNLDSLNSDGIPVGEELNESGEAQYLWSSECSGISQISSPEEEDHDDDMEIVDKSETKLETSSGINSCKNLFTYFVFNCETFQTHFKQSLKSNPKHLFFSMQNIFIISFHLYFRSYLLIWIPSCRTHGQIFRNNQRPHLPSSTQPSLEPLFDCYFSHCGCHGPGAWCWSF